MTYQVDDLIQRYVDSNVQGFRPMLHWANIHAIVTEQSVDKLVFYDGAVHWKER